MKVSPAGFAHMTDMLAQLAQGRLVLALEVGQPQFVKDDANYS